VSKQTKQELISEVGLLHRRTQAMQDLFDEVAAARMGINRTDMRLLDILDTEGPMPAGKLADINRLSRPAMSAALDRLEKAGYARRVRDAEDRRQVLVEPTQKMHDVAAEIWGPMAEVGNRAFGSYSVTELEIVVRFMRDTLEVFPPEIERVTASIAGPMPDPAAPVDTVAGEPDAG